MSSAGDIRQHVEQETERRTRLAVPALAGGVLYLLSAIIGSAALKGAPTVGLLQGLAPALRGEANPAVSPRAPEVKFISRHALPLITGSMLAAVAVGALTLILLLLADAARHRRPESWRLARPLALYGGAAVALVSAIHQVVSAIEAHKFAVGHDLSNHAVERALSTSAPNLLIEYVDLIAGLAFMTGMIAVAFNSMRVGLVPRWMGFVGMLSGLLIFLPIGGAELQVVPAFWMVMIGLLCIGRWPNGEPPAWAAGEARPWPSQAQVRSERRAARAIPAAAGAGGEVAPASAPGASMGSSRKRRKRGTRR